MCLETGSKDCFENQITFSKHGSRLVEVEHLVTRCYSDGLQLLFNPLQPIVAVLLQHFKEIFLQEYFKCYFIN